MSIGIRTNVASLSIATDMMQAEKAMTSNLARVSSGLRITKAADDSAALAVATDLVTAARSTRQSMRNSNDGISIIQTAEGASDEVVDILQRMRELAVQASSETLRGDERTYVQDEYGELQDEVVRVAAETEFSGLKLSDGTLTQLTVQVGINNSTSSRITFELGELTSTALGLLGTTADMASFSGAQSTLTTIDTALDSINSYRSEFGAVQNRLESALENSRNFQMALTSAASSIRDADFADETAEMTRNQITQQAGIAALIQARLVQVSVLELL